MQWSSGLRSALDDTLHISPTTVAQKTCVGGGGEWDVLACECREARICFHPGWYTTYIIYGMLSIRENLSRRRADKGKRLRVNTVGLEICFRSGW